MFNKGIVWHKVWGNFSSINIKWVLVQGEGGRVKIFLDRVHELGPCNRWAE